MEYIHYGAKEFDRGLFHAIENHQWIKPSGGFWASPVDSGFAGWRQWCEREDYRHYSDDDCFRFHLSDLARVRHIRCVEDVDNLPKENTPLISMIAVDFEAFVRDGYDALELHISECPSLYSAMYGWDVDSILIMNPDIIVT
jgi:hypothetical protein